MCSCQTTYTPIIGPARTRLESVFVIQVTKGHRPLEPTTTMPLNSPDTVPGPRTRHAATAMRALGNAFLGAALGLGCYYGLTDIAARLDQRAMRASFGGTAIASPRPPEPIAETTATLDFSDWESEDAAFWKRLGEGKAFGRIVIERMGLDAVVVKGTARSDLAKGPGWIVSTDPPGETGNTGISGHRTTYGAPFGKLDRLRKGDAIDLYSPYRRYRYEVATIRVVTPDKVEVIAHTDDPRLTLTACHPPYSARYRLVVQSRLVEVVRIDTGDR
ncbi:MAG: hypothetical protein C0418_01220 [Coriobacteriaceae bacterium]|nr:hypothetical protein [Coriobacteriaceae bacterium]